MRGGAGRWGLAKNHIDRICVEEAGREKVA